MNKKVISAILILASVGAGVFFRFYPLIIPSLGMIAKQEVYDGERNFIDKFMRQRYPDLPAETRAKISRQMFDEKLKTSREEIAAKIGSRATELKNHFRDSSGHIYLNGVDSYYWLRLLENLIKKGHIGDRLVDGVNYDDLIAAPIDPATKKNVHLWLGYVFYKAASFFHKDIPLGATLFYIPLILSCVIAIFSFCVAKKLGANDLGAFFASVAINLSPFFMIRSVGEWFDTDIYNVLFPLLAFGIFLYAFEKRNIAQRILFSALSGIFLACYASTWKGWWFIFDIMIISGVLFILNKKLSQSEEREEPGIILNHAVSIAFFFIFSTIFVIALNGFSVWMDFIREPMRLATILKVTTGSMWPNVFWTVAELGPATPLEVVNALGGFFVFFAGLLGLVYIFLFEKALRDNRYGFGLFCLVLWIVGTFYTAMEAMRFVLLLVVPVGLAFGLAITKLYQILERLLPIYFKNSVALLAARGVIIFLLSTYLIFNVATVHAKLLPSWPQMNTYWHNALTKIKNETPKDSIINSWWDFGHWFKAIAQRRVLFDGMTQNTPYSYWIAKVLLSDNEAEAVGILRMINTSDNKAVELLEASGDNNLAGAVDMILKACAMKKEEAIGYFKASSLPQEKIESLLEYLFPKELPPVYFIVSYDMPSKAAPISYIGNWDFKKVDMWFKKDKFSEVNFLTYLIKKYGYTQAEAQDLLTSLSLVDKKESRGWFSQHFSFVSVLSPSVSDDKLLFFDDGLTVNLDNYHAYVASDSKEKRGVPKSLVLLQDGKLKEVLQKDPTLPYSALIVKEGDSYKGFLLDTVLAKSLLVRLYFLEGDGLKYFKLYHKEEDDQGNSIYVYRIEWPKENEKFLPAGRQEKLKIKD